MKSLILALALLVVVFSDTHTVALSYDRDYLDRNGYPEDDENDYAELPYSLATRTNDERSFDEDVRFVDPELSWQQFLHHTDNSGSRKPSRQNRKTLSKLDSRRTWLDFVRHHDRTNGKKEKKKEKKKGRLRDSLSSPSGPPGPPGPRGPPGPPGAEITKEEMMVEFKKMVKEAAERRAERIIAQQCPGCLSPVESRNGTSSVVYDWDDIEVIPRIPAAFHCKLQTNVDIARKSLREVSNFQMPFAGGAFRRGQGLDVKSGRFMAQRTAIYQFSANVHLIHSVPKKDKEGRRLRSRDNVRVLICINSLCQRHTSLEFISGLESNSRVFTVNVNGLLQLEVGQYASVYIDNSSKRDISVQSGSDFTGIMVGV